MAAARGKTTRRPQSAKPAARRRSNSRQSQPATLSAAHVQGFFAGAIAGVLMGAAGMLWLTREDGPERPVASTELDTQASEAEGVSFEFYDRLGENLNLGGNKTFRERAGDNAESRCAGQTIQMGSFTQESDADRQRAQLTLLGLEGEIRTNSVNGQTHYRIIVGPFDNCSAVKRAQARAAQEDIDTLVLGPPGD